MAKKIHVSNGSILYLEGDPNNGKSYLLAEGKVVRNHLNLKGENETAYISAGNFFGLTSALAKTPREEAIQMMSDCVLVEMTNSELLHFLENDIKLLLRLLVLYSNEMLDVHRDIEDNLSFTKKNPEQSVRIFQLAKHYYNKENHHITKYILEKFIQLHPDHSDANEAKELLEKVNRLIELE